MDEDFIEVLTDVPYDSLPENGLSVNLFFMENIKYLEFQDLYEFLPRG
jgi:hypothetical protein